GLSSTPRCSDFAVKIGAEPNAGSSAMLTSRATTLLERMDRLSLPIVTFRPSAVVSCCSSKGRNVLTFTNSGTAATATIPTPTTAAATFCQCFMPPPSALGQVYSLTLFPLAQVRANALPAATVGDTLELPCLFLPLLHPAAANCLPRPRSSSPPNPPTSTKTCCPARRRQPTFSA